MLEALEPVPGVDAERLLEVIEGAPTEIEHDPRDMKIVHLSKKTRKLTVGNTSLKTKLKSAQDEVSSCP